ncbi:Aminotransferase class V/Cysteine desulfurase [Macrophomina phaseolina MS6]|uniref:Aminotransferase class V/Cysteine desulfurase n=1 Tax=Macrophomina phaseolina (strain MS6) TaxID=1126212 RepID=K2RVI7_MACPH|nr:Aminotransferase class V/Cysteine desulfurase [Macrophomina phaseolina MS6]
MGEIVNSTASPFGRKLRKDFFFDEDYININHGSFGTYPKPVREALYHWQSLAEARPDEFIRYTYPAELRKARALMASYLKVPLPTVVFVPNATTGVNTVLRNLVFAPGDVIVYFATIYGACENTVKYICETTPAQSAKVSYTFPIEDDELVRRFREVVAREQDAGRNVKVAIFDTVVSLPGVRLPFEALTRACRELGVLSLIDGAHGIGQVDLDLGALDPDFFVSNCHKWLLTPRPCAIFYVPIRNQHLMRSTLPTSHGFVPRPDPTSTDPYINPLPPSSAEESAFEENFGFFGSRDNSPFLCVAAALEYRRSLGGEQAIRSYCEALAREGGARVAALLGTEVMDNATHTLSRCFFANVRLPVTLAACETAAEVAAAERRKKAVDRAQVPSLVKNWVARTLVFEYGGFQALIEYGGGWWVRLSAMVYLEMADFEWAAGVLKEVCKRLERGEWLEDV